MYYHKSIAPNTFKTCGDLIAHIAQETGITEELITKCIPFEESPIWRCEICISSNDKAYLSYCQLRDPTYNLITRELEDGSWESDTKLYAFTVSGDEIDMDTINDIRFSITESTTSCSMIPFFVKSLGFFENVYHCSCYINNRYHYSFNGKKYIPESNNRLLFLAE